MLWFICLIAIIGLGICVYMLIEMMDENQSYRNDEKLWENRKFENPDRDDW